MNGIPIEPSPNITSSANENYVPFDQEANFLDDAVADPQIQPIRDQIGFDFDNSIKTNAFVAFISTSKVITTILVLSLAHLSCFEARETWMALMLAFDFIYATLHIIKLYTMFSLKRVEPVQRASIGMGNRVQDAGQVAPRINNEENDHFSPTHQINLPLVEHNPATIDLYKNLEKRKRLISRIVLFNDAIYLGLLIYGQILYFIEEDLVCQSLPVNDLMLVYLIFGYIWLLLPLGLLVLACLCIPCIMCCYLALNRTQVPANNSAIRKLPVKKYKEEEYGGGECAICMVEYNEDDKIIQLECSHLHYFHEGCLKKWLKINGQCPTCRMRLDQMKKN